VFQPMSSLSPLGKAYLKVETGLIWNSQRAWGAKLNRSHTLFSVLPEVQLGPFLLCQVFGHSILPQWPWGKYFPFYIRCFKSDFCHISIKGIMTDHYTNTNV
jgi:hypothetical protein